jgi:hypothetical protein
MRHYIPTLLLEPSKELSEPEGIFLVRVESARYRHYVNKPFIALSFAVLKPQEKAGTSICGRLYCTAKAAWRLRWFLRDFGYDTELSDRGVVDEKTLIGLQGIVNVSYSTISGRPLLNLDGFAAAERWMDPSAAKDSAPPSAEVNNDL